MLKLRYLLLVALIALPVAGQNISHLKLKTVDGKRFEMKKELGDGPVVVAFWATWCKPCRKELPAMLPMFEKYSEKGLKIVAISQDSPRSLSKVKSYVKTSKLPYIFLLDPNGEESTRFQVKDVPYLLLSDRDGNVVWSHRGYREGDEKELEEKVEDMFSAPEAAEK